MSMKPIFAFVMIAFVASLVSAEVTSFQEGVLPTGAYTHDATYIRSNDGTGNFDNDPDLELIVGTTAGGDPDVLRTILEFAVNAIPASAQIGGPMAIPRSMFMRTGLTSTKRPQRGMRRAMATQPPAGLWALRSPRPASMSQTQAGLSHSAIRTNSAPPLRMH